MHRPRRRAVRRAAAGVLVVVTAMLATLGTAGIWQRRTITDRDRYLEIVGPLIEDPRLKDALARAVAESVFEVVRVGTAVRRLPAPVQGAADAIARSLRSIAQDRARRLLEGPDARRVWLEIAADTHGDVVSALEGDGRTIAIDITPLVDEAIEAVEERAEQRFGFRIDLPSVGQIGTVAGPRFRQEFGTVVVYRGRTLGPLQSAAANAARDRIPLLAAAAVAFVAALAVSVNRLRTAGYTGLASAAGLGVMIVVSNWFADQVVGSSELEDRAAVRTIVDPFARDLRSFVLPVLVAAAVIGAAAWTTARVRRAKPGANDRPPVATGDTVHLT